MPAALHLLREPAAHHGLDQGGRLVLVGLALDLEVERLEALDHLGGPVDVLAQGAGSHLTEGDALHGLDDLLGRALEDAPVGVDADLHVQLSFLPRRQSPLVMCGRPRVCLGACM